MASDEIEVRGSGEFPTVAPARSFNSRLAATDPALALPRQLLLAQDRAEWLGARLREQVAAEGVRGVVGDSFQVTLDGRPVRVGEYSRVLFEQERKERELVALLAERVARLGLGSDRDLRRGDLADAVAHGVRATLAALGHDMSGEPAPETLAVAHTAFLNAWNNHTGEGLSEEEYKRSRPTSPTP